MAFKLIESAQTRWRAINAPHLVARPGGTMSTPIPAALFADPAPAQRPERAAAAPRSHGFTVEILDDAAAARARINDLIPEGASVFTEASETLRLSGIDADINANGRYQAVKPRTQAMDRVTGADDIRRLLASPTSWWAASPRSPKPAPWWPLRGPQARPPVHQHGGMKPLVVQPQPTGDLPGDVAPQRTDGLPVRQALKRLQHHHRGDHISRHRRVHHPHGSGR
jgi:hypothetical protein